MTTTETTGVYPPLPPTPPTAPHTVLRRSTTGRVGAGVAAGLGEYFGLDPVLFRVLFATSAFFGGAGVIAYLLAWAAIPEAGTGHAPIDGWVGRLRRRHVPVWLVAGVAGLLLWLTAFSWWAPGPFLPVLVVVVVLVVAFGRRDWQARPGPDGAPTAPPSAAPTVLLTKDAPASDPTAPVGTPDGTAGPTWTGDARAWLAESRAARRARRARTLPVRMAVLLSVVVALIVLGIVDAVSGIALPVYFWTLLAIVGTGLLVGMTLRRTPWSVALLLVPTLVGLMAFAGSHASMHDGFGQRSWRPTTTPAANYRLAFGQGVLDLRSLPAQSQPRTVRVTMGAGQLRILAPRTMNLTVEANVHLGDLRVDGHQFGGAGTHTGGVNFNRTIDPPSGATGPRITVSVHLADGDLDVRRS